MMPVTYVVQGIRDTDRPQDQELGMGLVLYAGIDAATAFSRACMPAAEVGVRIVVWRDGCCAERWVRLYHAHTEAFAFQKFTRTLDEDAPESIVLGGEWKPVGRFQRVPDFVPGDRHAWAIEIAEGMMAEAEIVRARD